ncbi:hypothetical protein F5Y03DRAFT_389288 [Xylaria venustula]|nr:hypothetical protein F5Y03DRAFT_389288 [Xylaria venustula]
MKWKVHERCMYVKVSLLSWLRRGCRSCENRTPSNWDIRRGRGRPSAESHTSSSTPPFRTPKGLNTRQYLGPPAATICRSTQPSLMKKGRRDFDAKVVTAEPGQHDHARSSLFKSFGESASSGLGRLQRLPFELLSSICLLLDLQSALNFSQASRSARETIGSIPQYHRLREHSLECIWALSRTGLSHHTSISDLHAALLTELCVICGSFGGFLFLPSATRCCFACIESAPGFRIISFHSLQKESRRLATWLKRSHPVIHSIPGSYSSNEKEYTSRRKLVSGHHALQFPRADHDEDPRAILGKLPDSPVLRCMAACRLPYFNLATGDLQLGISCKGCQIAMEANFSDANFSRRERLYSRDGGKGALGF